MRTYLDTSALVKLVQAEPESHALREYLRTSDADAVTSALARVELVRAVTAGGPELVLRVRRLLGQVQTIALTQALLDAAADLRADTTLRSLDAIHLAAAQLAVPLQALITYDQRMIEHALVLALPVAVPIP